jgi:nitrite reductase/ring-hydroxylating ferredoxin subunit
MTDLETARGRWHPIAAAHDLPHRHVYHGQLLGREMAVWRADDDHVNVWENRCLHRGVRLSIGVNDGRELKCQYHGWRYANRTAGCTYIPAHPADAPARTITNRIFPSTERWGLVWTALEEGADLADVDGLLHAKPLALRGVTVNAPADLVLEHLEGHRFLPTDALACLGRRGAVGSARSLPDGKSGFFRRPSRQARRWRTAAIFFVQPLDSGRSVIRGVLDAEPSSRVARLSALRHHNDRLSALRDAAERAAAERPAPEPITPPLRSGSPRTRRASRADPFGPDRRPAGLSSRANGGRARTSPASSCGRSKACCPPPNLAPY